MKANGTLRKYVVIALATNGVIKPETITELFNIAGSDRKFVFVTGYAPRYATWVPQANAVIHDLAKRIPTRLPSQIGQKLPRIIVLNLQEIKSIPGKPPRNTTQMKLSAP
ncbi:hypothetical protein RQN30_04890 [Arcanobacterium hippocoleae]